MLVLSRRNKEAVVVGGLERFERMIKITVVEITRRRVRLAFEAAADVPVNRFEVWKRRDLCRELICLQRLTVRGYSGCKNARQINDISLRNKNRRDESRSASKLLVIAASAQNNSRVISWHDHTVRSTNSCLPNVRPRSGVAPLVTIQFQRGQ